MSLADALERAASALPDAADAIRDANGDADRVLEALPPQAAAGVLAWLLTEDAEAAAELADAWSLNAAAGPVLDALEALRPVDEVAVQRVEPLEGLDRVAVELTAPLQGGGQAHYSVQLADLGDDTWVILWFHGPGVEWPSHRRPRGDGLTVSSPPRDE